MCYIDPIIVQANYQQKCIDLEGCLYKRFLTYQDLPEGGVIKNYTDTADEGKDYLCSINYLDYKQQAYVLDVLYTKDSMDKTRHTLTRMLANGEVALSKIESNNGARYFAQTIKEKLKKDYDDNRTVIKWFHQSKNKLARIHSNSWWVQENIFFPENWHQRWPEFYEALTSYQKEGKNKNDDAPDALTGVAENCSKKKFIPACA